MKHLAKPPHGCVSRATGSLEVEAAVRKKQHSFSAGWGAAKNPSTVRLLDICYVLGYSLSVSPNLPFFFPFPLCQCCGVNRYEPDFSRLRCCSTSHRGECNTARFDGRHPCRSISIKGCSPRRSGAHSHWLEISPRALSAAVQVSTFVLYSTMRELSQELEVEDTVPISPEWISTLSGGAW
jgi:hypothetical protein